MQLNETTKAVINASSRTKKAFLSVLKAGRKIVTGKTANSLEVKNNPFGFKLLAGRSLLFIQYGRKPKGKMPVYKKGNKFYLFPDLAAWKAKLGLKMSDFALARGIAKRGIKPFDVFNKATLEIGNKNETEIKKAFGADLRINSVLDAKKTFKK